MTPAILHTQVDIRGPPGEKSLESFRLWSTSGEAGRIQRKIPHISRDRRGTALKRTQRFISATIISMI